MASCDMESCDVALLHGANIMCPGLTSPGAVIHDDVPEAGPPTIMLLDAAFILIYI